MRPWWHIALVALLLVSAAPERAHAEQPRILVLLDDDTQPVGTRLKAELDALGFDVVQPEAAPAAPSRRGLERAARDADAVAALRVRSSPRGVEVWVSDRVTGKTVLREVVLPSITADSDALVALRAVELLRASLLEIDAPHPSRGEVAPPPQAREIVAAERPAEPAEPSRWMLALAPAMALSPGGFGVTPHVRLGFAFRVTEQLPVGIEVITPTVPAHIEGPEGSASVTVGLAGAGVDALFAPPDSTYNGRAGVGCAVVWVHIAGAAEPPLEGTTDDVVGAFPYLRLGASRAIVGSLRLVLDTRLGLATPQPVVLFAGREAAEWGEPAMFASLGIELAVD